MYDWVFYIKIEIKCYFNFFFSFKVFVEELLGSVYIINLLVLDLNGICKIDVIVNLNVKKSN